MSMRRGRRRGGGGRERDGGGGNSGSLSRYATSLAAPPPQFAQPRGGRGRPVSLHAPAQTPRRRVMGGEGDSVVPPPPFPRTPCAPLFHLRGWVGFGGGGRGAGSNLRGCREDPLPIFNCPPRNPLSFKKGKGVNYCYYLFKKAARGCQRSKRGSFGKMRVAGVEARDRGRLPGVIRRGHGAVVAAWKDFFNRFQICIDICYSPGSPWRIWQAERRGGGWRAKPREAEAKGTSWHRACLKRVCKMGGVALPPPCQRCPEFVPPAVLASLPSP